MVNCSELTTFCAVLIRFLEAARKVNRINLYFNNSPFNLHQLQSVLFSNCLNKSKSLKRFVGLLSLSFDTKIQKETKQTKNITII